MIIFKSRVFAKGYFRSLIFSRTFVHHAFWENKKGETDVWLIGKCTTNGPEPNPTKIYGAQVDWKWTGSGPEVVWNWSESGPEVVRKWSGSDLEVALEVAQKLPRSDPEVAQKWTGSGPEVIQEWSGIGLEVFKK